LDGRSFEKKRSLDGNSLLKYPNHPSMGVSFYSFKNG
jgi:hypothetical protein